jgi:hypothetical protein
MFTARKLITTSAIAAAAFLPMAALASPANAAATNPKPQLQFGAASVDPVAAVHTVVTQFSAVPDSGYDGNNWGYDFYKQTFTWDRIKQVTKTECGNRALRCFEYDWSLKLTGFTQTIEGQMSPGEPFTPLDVVENANLTGTMSGTYLSSYKRVFTQYVPSTYDANGVNPAGNYQPQLWFALAQPGSYEVNTTATSYLWSFGYSVTKGSDAQCPAYSGHWTDAYNVTEADSGNILAPNAADCPAQS